MAKQSRLELEKKIQLEAWSKQVINVLTCVSNGDWNTRLTPEGGNNELLATSRSINNMISRYSRLREETQYMEKAMTAIQAYLHALRVAKVSGTPVQLPHTNTPIDLLVKELMELPGASPLFRHSNDFAMEQSLTEEQNLTTISDLES